MPSNETWLFFRGLARTNKHWADFPEKFEEKIGGQIQLLDFPGVGERRDELSPLSTSGMVEQMRAQVLAQHNGPFNLLGISLGAMLGMEWAAKYPGDVKRLVVINGSAGNLSPLFKRTQPAAFGLFWKLLKTKDVGERERLILDFITNHMIDREKWTSIFIKELRDRPIRPRNLLRHFLAARRFKVGAITCPTLVINSRGDRLIHHECGAAIAGHLHATLKTHANGGHDLILDDAAWVIDAVAQWINRVNS